jgi:hypothetical protein
MARPYQTPGGWGAEESEARFGPGPEATVGFMAEQGGRWLAEMGRYYDSPNDSVNVDFAGNFPIFRGENIAARGTCRRG